MAKQTCLLARRRLALSLLLLLGASCLSAVQARKAQLGELRVLAIGDSITEGAVPSRGSNHPYTNTLRALLQQKYPGTNIVMDNKGVGGSGIFATGFNNPTTVGPVAMASLQTAKGSGRPYDYTVVMVGINDLLRMGRSADDVMGGLQGIYDAAMASGSNVIAIPPFGAPGFVQKDDSKEGERKKLASKIHAAASSLNAQRFSPKMTVLDLQSGPMDFYAMSDDARKQWLDDGLHLTQQGYDNLAGFIAGAINNNAVQRRH